jgi:serine protein kinase
MMASIDLQSILNKWKTSHGVYHMNWQGSFEDYLKLVKANPKITRNAFQRMYDMIVESGTEEYEDFKKKLIRYKFFDDAKNNGKDAVFGLDLPIMKLVNVLRSAALGYGTEKRVILLHGPVGSAKSTICRFLNEADRIGIGTFQPKDEKNQDSTELTG